MSARERRRTGQPSAIGDGGTAAVAAAGYGLLAVLFTWPLSRGLARDIPGDFGDPLLNAWILAWDATHLFSGWQTWWDANIFHPHPLALAYSEHLAAQAIQILPIHGITGNPILAYNLLLLASYVLSGLGMYLLVGELTGDRGPSLVAGLAYAFAPYRAASLPHLQVLSSQWMPFVLLAFRRYFSTGRPAYLAWAAVAWWLQNLSCGYYLLFFAPIVALYLVWELTTRRLWRDSRVLLSLAIACAVVGAGTLPFLLPYLELRRLGFSPRSLVETQKFSADVYAYLTADPNLRVWGSLARAWPRAEGSLFPGLTVTVLAIWATWRATLKGRAIAAVAAGALAIVLLLLFGFSIRLPVVKITSLGRALVVIAIAGAVTLTVSRATRAGLRGWLRTPAGFFAAITVFSIVMSFGPAIHAQGRVVLDTNLYALFYRFVPGFDGLRVPARFGTIVAFGLAVLAGLGLAALPARGRSRLAVSMAAALFIAIESFAAPIPLNENSADYVRPGLAPLPSTVREVPPVYDFLRTLPANSSIVELPLGEPAFDVRYMFFSTRHWKPLVNGYSGGRPADYELLDQMLQDVFTRPDRAWSTLRRARPTHAVVHEALYTDGRGALVSQWLRANGAREIAAFETDRVFALP